MSEHIENVLECQCGQTVFEIDLRTLTAHCALGCGRRFSLDTSAFTE